MKQKDKEKSKSEVYGDRGTVKLNSEKMKERDRRIKVLKIGLLICLLFLIIIYFLLVAMYSNGKFTISIDRDFSKNSGIIAFENLDKRDYKISLETDNLEFADNISVNWIPKNINDEADGSHNGENYVAYTFYVQNMGERIINYWYTIPIDDTIKNADEAIRVMVIRNGEKTIYGKSAAGGGAEDGTVEFFSNDIVEVEKRADFGPGDIDKFTLVIWIEGDDPECINNIIGGEVKMHMEITSENIHQK